MRAKLAPYLAAAAFFFEAAKIPGLLEEVDEVAGLVELEGELTTFYKTNFKKMRGGEL